MEQKLLVLTEKFLDEVTDQGARTLVGKLLKRVEVIKDSVPEERMELREELENHKKLLRKLCRELVYESFRNLRWVLISFGKGYRDFEITDFEKKPLQDKR